MTAARLNAVLDSVQYALRPRRSVLMRMADAGAGCGYRLSGLGDRLICACGPGCGSLPSWAVAMWIDALRRACFPALTTRMSTATPFAAVLIVATSR